MATTDTDDFGNPLPDLTDWDTFLANRDDQPSVRLSSRNLVRVVRIELIQDNDGGLEVEGVYGQMRNGEYAVVSTTPWDTFTNEAVLMAELAEMLNELAKKRTLGQLGITPEIITILPG